jgi:predicted ribosomally synthesized peptide with SipW-like signal peptide
MDTTQISLAMNHAARRRRRRLVALLAAALAVLSLGAGQLSLALFTDQESVAATFSTGSIDLDGAAIAGLTLTTSGMMPGDSVTDDVLVSNIGTAQLRYAMSTASTNPDTKLLRGVLTLTVKTIDATTPGTPCSDFDGTSVLAATVLGASTAGFGSSAPGAQAGDRTLNAAASETLCFRVTLPSGTGNAYQSATTTTTFTFDAEQTASNP